MRDPVRVSLEAGRRAIRNDANGQQDDQRQTESHTDHSSRVHLCSFWTATGSPVLWIRASNPCTSEALHQPRFTCSRISQRPPGVEGLAVGRFEVGPIFVRYEDSRCKELWSRHSIPRNNVRASRVNGRFSILERSLERLLPK